MILTYLIQYDYHGESSSHLHQTLNLQRLPLNQNFEEVHQLNQFELVDTVYNLKTVTTYYDIFIVSHVNKMVKS